MGRTKKEFPAAQGAQQGKCKVLRIIGYRKDSDKILLGKSCAAKIIAATDTQRAAYARTGRLRETELQRARAFFRRHPRQAYSRACLGEELNLPINHITRIVYDLKEAGFIESAGRGINPRSNITVELVRFKEKGDGDE